MLARIIAWVRRQWAGATFSIRFMDGDAVVETGRVPGRFLEDCRDIARQAGLRTGHVYGVQEGGRTQLSFSSHLSAGIRQRLRNAWHFHQPR